MITDFALDLKIDRLRREMMNSVNQSLQSLNHSTRQLSQRLTSQLSDLHIRTVRVEQSHADFGHGNYLDDLNVAKLISVQAGQRIKIKFLAFNTEFNYDHVRFYTKRGGRLLASYSGNLSPGFPELMGDDHDVYYTWTTDGSTTRSGWRFEYFAV